MRSKYAMINIIKNKLRAAGQRDPMVMAVDACEETVNEHHQKDADGNVIPHEKEKKQLYKLVHNITMFSFLLPIASKIVSDAIDKIPDDAELGEKLIDLCLVILKKAVKLTKTDMDDKLLAQVESAIKAR